MRSLVGLALLALAGCQSAKEFSVLGYSTGSQFDPDIKSVYVPVFKNVALETSPYRDIEVDITRAVIREISTRTPMKIVTDSERADTELIGTLVRIEKKLLNRNQQNNPREAEIVLHVSVVWRDLRDGRVLSNPRLPKRLEVTPPPFDPTLPPPPTLAVREEPRPTFIVASGRLLPEVGESNTTAAKLAMDQLAKQIVNMMERPW